MIARLEFGEDEVDEAMDAMNIGKTLSKVWQIKEGLRMYLKHMPDKDPVAYLEHLYDEICDIKHFCK